MPPIEVEGDFGSLQKQIEVLTKEFLDLAGVTRDSLKEIKQLDKQGDLAARSLRALDTQGRKVSQSFIIVKDAVVATNRVIETTGKLFEKLSLATLRELKANGQLTRSLENELKVREQLIAAKSVKTIVGDIRARTPLGDADTRRFGDPAELARLQAALIRLQKVIGNSAVVANRTRQAFNNLSTEGRAAFNKLPQDVQIALRLVEKEMRNTSTRATRLAQDFKLVQVEIARLQQVKKTNLIQKLFGDQVRKETGLGSAKIISQADTAAIVAANAALKNLTTSLSGSSAEAINARRALLDLKRKGLEALNKLTPEVQKKVVALQRALKNLAAPAKKAREQLKIDAETTRRLDLASTAATNLAAQFNRLNKSASPERIAKFNSALINLQGVIKKTGVGSGALQRAFLKLQAGGAQAFTATEAKVVPALQRINLAMRQTEVQMTRTGQSFSLGFNLIGRIVIGGAIHRGFFAITSALRQSITAAKDFSIAIAEIETLSQRNKLTTKEWSDAVFTLSEEFNRTAQDVAEGVYQTLSNQVAQGAEAFLFMRTALNLSLATISTAEEAVNALTGVINAFGLETREAGRIASQFFTIVELGRVRLGELSNTMGRVNAIGAQLGVSFAEIGAFIDVATIGGIRANESLTQLRNVFLKLLRPTEALRKRLKSLGFESGAALIEARGFVGVFDLLNKIIREEGITVITELFGRIRAITGALQAGGDGAAQFRKDLEKLNSELNFSAEAADIVRNSFGDRFERQLQQASNFFSQEFGRKFIEAFVQIVDAVGGARRALQIFFQLLGSGAIIGAVVLFKTLIASLVAVKIATDATTIATIRLNRAQKASLSVLGVTLLIAAFIQLKKVIDEVWDNAVRAQKKYFDSVEANLKKQREDFETQRGFIIASVRRTTTETSRVWFAAIADQRRELFSLQDELKLRNKEIGRALTESLKQTEKAAKALIKGPADAIKELTNSIESAQERIKSIVQTTEGRIFDKSIDQAKDINEQLKLIDERVEDLRGKAVDATIAGDEKSVNRFFSQIQSLQERQAKLVGDFNRDQTEATQNLTDLRIKNSKLEIQQQEKQLKLRKVRRDFGLNPRQRRLETQKLGLALEDIGNKQAKNTEEIRKQETLLRSSIRGNITVEQIQARRTKSSKDQVILLKELIKIQEEERKKQAELLKEREVKANKLFTALEKLNTLEQDLRDGLIGQAEALGEIDAVRKAGAALFGATDFNARLNLITSLAEKENNIRERFILKTAATNLDAREKVARADKKLLNDSFTAEEKNISKLKDLEQESLRSLTKTRASLLQSQEQLFAAARKDFGVGGISSLVRQITDAAIDIETGATTFTGFGARGGRGIIQNNIQKVADAILALTSSTEENFDRAAEKAEEVLHSFIQNTEISRREATGLTGDELRKKNPLLTQLGDLVRLRLAQVEEFRSQRRERLTAESRLDDTQASLDFLNEAQNKVAKSTAKVIQPTLDLADAYRVADENNKKQLESSKKTRAEFQSLQATRTRAERNARVTRFAHGGLARGTDTIHAMLTPGEFIVNRRSTAQFLPILRAINAGGIRPQRFQDGGTVEGDQSITVGDVTINAGSAHINTTELTRLLKRAVFEKKIRIKGL